MSIAEKLTQIAENEQKVYEAGKNAEWNTFWDSYQDYGNRTDYTYDFYKNAKWNDNNFKPKYNIVLSGSTSYVFNGIQISGDLAETLENLGVSIDTSNATSLNNAFRQMDNCTRFPEINLTNIGAVGCMYNFYLNANLEAIDKIIFANDCKATDFTGTLSRNPELKNLTIDGKIGANGLNLSASKMLSKESITSVINAL